MSETPWLTIIGLGEDAPDALPPASRKALEDAEIIMGPPRHLNLIPDTKAERIVWPVPFADGLDKLLALRGRSVVVLASGNPFWFGAGSSITRHLNREEWRALPGLSTFSMVAARMGWALEKVACLGLHAAPFERMRPALAREARLIILLRDGDAVSKLCDYLCSENWGDTSVTIFQALGGPNEKQDEFKASEPPETEFQHPVCAALKVAGDGAALSLASGRSDTLFDSDGTMTKQPVRALTLSALAPKPGEHLWDIGGGSGSIAIEWLLAHPNLSATTIEPRADRVARIEQNARKLGVDRLNIVEGQAPDALSALEPPDVVFIGGGLTQNLLDWLEANLRSGTRLVANAVTLETEAVLVLAQQRFGGSLMRFEISHVTPLGSKSGWKAGYPIVQWSAVL